MFGTQGEKSVVAVCGFAAAVVAVGLISYEAGAQSAQSQLYVASKVQPTFAPAALVQGAVRPQFVPAASNVMMGAQRVPQTANVESAYTLTINKVTASLCLGVAAMAAFVSAAVQRKQPEDQLAIAMMAASGKKAAPKKAAPASDEGDAGGWFPGAEPLNNGLLGDRGFDPLGLGKDPAVLARNQQCEIFHGRLAMLAFAGGLIPELLGKPAWNKLTGSGEVDPAFFATLIIATIVVFAPLEIFRARGAFESDRSGDKNYPGFDPFGLASDETKLKEIKNGRLAMVAVLGFAIQSAYTGASPIENAVAHYTDPFAHNITTVGMF